MSRWRLVLIGVAAVLILIIVLQNTKAVETRILFLTVTMPRAVLLFVTALVGFIVGLGAAGRVARRTERKE